MIDQKSLKEHFTKVYEVLQREVKAPADFLESFLDYAIDWRNNHYWQTREFRFCGSLGMGGKIYLDPEGYRVGCYSEDLTNARRLACQRVNQQLCALFMPKKKEDECAVQGE